MRPQHPGYKLWHQKKNKISKYFSFLVIWEVKGGLWGPSATASWAVAMDGGLTSSAQCCQGPGLGGHGDKVCTLEHVYGQTPEPPQSGTTANTTHMIPG